MNLTATNNTVWVRGLTCKISCLQPEMHTVFLIIRNRSFTLIIGDGQKSRLGRLKNGIPQVLVLATLFCNLYKHNLFETTAKKLAHANNFPIFYCSRNWRVLRVHLPGLGNSILLPSKLEAEVQRNQNGDGAIF